MKDSEEGKAREKVKVTSLAVEWSATSPYIPPRALQTNDRQSNNLTQIRYHGRDKEMSIPSLFLSALRQLSARHAAPLLSQG